MLSFKFLTYLLLLAANPRNRPKCLIQYAAAHASTSEAIEDPHHQESRLSIDTPYRRFLRPHRHPYNIVRRRRTYHAFRPANLTTASPLTIAHPEGIFGGSNVG